MYPPMGPSDIIYLNLAGEAIEYVRNKVKNGSANRSEDKAERKSKNFQPLDQKQLDSQRATSQLLTIEKKQSTIQNHAVEAPQILDIDDDICFVAEQVEFSGFGNCGEQAAVAYKWLRRFPLAGLVYLNLKGGNHSFVVIGAGPGVIENSEFTIHDAYGLLGPGAIICDPWLSGGGRCFRVMSQWSQAIAQMLEEAMPTANPDSVRIQCIARCQHQTRTTKVIQWNSKRRENLQAKAKASSSWSFW